MVQHTQHPLLVLGNELGNRHLDTVEHLDLAPHLLLAGADKTRLLLLIQCHPVTGKGLTLHRHIERFAVHQHPIHIKDDGIKG